MYPFFPTKKPPHFPGEGASNYFSKNIYTPFSPLPGTRRIIKMIKMAM
jgi:hypothetical protein